MQSKNPSSFDRPGCIFGEPLFGVLGFLGLPQCRALRAHLIVASVRPRYAVILSEVTRRFVSSRSCGTSGHAVEARLLALTQEGLRPGWFPGNPSSFDRPGCIFGESFSGFLGFLGLPQCRALRAHLIVASARPWYAVILSEVAGRFVSSRSCGTSGHAVEESLFGFLDYSIDNEIGSWRPFGELLTPPTASHALPILACSTQG